MMKLLDHYHGNKVNSMFRQEHRREGTLWGKICPNLDPRRVIARLDKRLHLQVLFQRLRFPGCFALADMMISQDPGAFSCLQRLFWTKVILDKGDNEKRIKISLGAKSPLEYRKILDSPA